MNQQKPISESLLTAAYAMRYGLTISKAKKHQSGNARDGWKYNKETKRFER